MKRDQYKSNQSLFLRHKAILENYVYTYDTDYSNLKSYNL